MNRILFFLLLPFTFNQLYSQTTSPPKFKVAIKLVKINDTSNNPLIIKYFNNFLIRQNNYVIIDAKDLGYVSIKNYSGGARSGDFMDTALVTQLKSRGTEFLILINADLDTTYLSEGKIKGYKCIASYEVQIINVSTSQIIASESYYGSVGGGIMDPHPIPNPTTAMNEALIEASKESNEYSNQISLTDFLKNNIIKK